MSLAKIDKERIIDVKGMNYTLINNCDVSTDSCSHIWQMPKMGVVRKITIKIIIVGLFLMLRLQSLQLCQHLDQLISSVTLRLTDQGVVIQCCQ